jgi:N-acetyl-anhydromuramyl-L-alanine amidase AmpD
MMQDYEIYIEPRLVKNFWKGRGDYQPVAIVQQMIQGNLETAYQYFNREKGSALVSAHYGVAKDGRVWQFVREEDIAWANGILQEPDTSLDWIAEIVAGKHNPNQMTISIAYEGKVGETLTEAQYEATLALHAQIIRRWDIPADANHIVGHNKFDSLERKDNPGSAFPFQRLLNDLNGNSVFRSEIFTVPDENPVFKVPPEDTQPFNLAEPAIFDDTPTYVPEQPLVLQPTKPDLFDSQPLDLSFEPILETPPPSPPPVVENSLPEEMGGNNITWATLGGGVINVDLANVRMRPSYEPSTIMRTAGRGTRLHFDGFSDGPEVQGNTRWFHISRDDGGGWINASLIKLDKSFPS